MNNTVVQWHETLYTSDIWRYTPRRYSEIRRYAPCRYSETRRYAPRRYSETRRYIPRWTLLSVQMDVFTEQTDGTHFLACCFVWSALNIRQLHRYSNVHQWTYKRQISNRTRPRALVQNQHTRELISARNTNSSSTTITRVACGNSHMARVYIQGT